MIKTQQLEYRLNQEKNKYGLVGAKPAKVREFEDADYSISAHINPKDWGIDWKTPEWGNCRIEENKIINKLYVQELSKFCYIHYFKIK